MNNSCAKPDHGRPSLVRTGPVLLVSVALVAAGLAATALGSSRLGQGAQLHVNQVLVGHTRYIEGSYSYIRVTRIKDGQRVDREIREGMKPRLLSLSPGAYRIQSWQRPCVGTCDRLDAPVDRCSRSIRIARGSTLRATIRLSPGSGCRIETAA